MTIGEETRERTIQWTIETFRNRMESRKQELPEKGLCNKMKEKALDMMRDIEAHIRTETAGC